MAAGVAAGNVASARPGASPASVAQAAGAAAAAATGPKPFAEVIKDAKEMPGLFRAWQKDEKVWIEIAPDQFGVPYLFTSNLSRGVGEQGVYGGMMLGDQIVEWKRIGNAVQLIAKNYAFTGGANAPIAQGVKEGFTDSLLGATTVVSQPHPERKTVLIDANALLLTDIPVGERFTTGIHMRSYTFDAKNSSFEAVKNSRRPVVVRRFRALSEPARDASPGAHADTAPPSPFPPFTTLPDGRSLFLGYTYNFAKLPEPMAARRADPRVGHFESQVWDFSTDSKFTAKTHYVNRWRLEKKDPAAALSEPKEPIVFWIDRNVPEKYRAAVRDGILEWNKAFEKIGFKDAIVVKQQDQEGTIDTFDARHSTVRWFVSTDAGFAIGPSTVDPRTGEILNAQVAIPEDWSRVNRTFIVGAGAVRLAGVRRVQGVARPRRPPLHVRLGRAGRDGVRARRAGRARRDRAGKPRSRRVRQRLAQGRRHARGGPHARAAAQLPRVHRLSAREDLGPGMEPRTRHLGLGDGLHPDQHRRERRSPGRVFRADDRPVRLLGDRVRVPAAAEGDRSRRAREDRRARRERSAARVLVRRGGDRGPRPRCEPVRSRVRSARLPAEEARDLAGALATAADQAVEAGRVVRRPAPHLRRRLPASHAVPPR